MRGSPHGSLGDGAQNRTMMVLPRDPSFTLTLQKQCDGARSGWEIRCEGESLGAFDSLSEALATARTMAANWLGEADTVRLIGGDLSIVIIDEFYSRLAGRPADNEPY